MIVDHPGRLASALACLLLLAAAPAMAQSVAGYSEYFIPADETTMWYVFDNLDAAATTPMHSVIAVTAWSENTTIYYDHWENGYNFDPNNPATADETYILATAGAQRIFESANIPTAPRGTATYYDGGDRIYIAGGTATVTRATWVEGVGAGNQSAAWEIYPVKPQLTTYVLPFGENLGFTPFNRVYVLIQATANNTTFTVDLNGDGTPDLINANRNATKSLADGDTTTVTLNAGQTFLLDQISACRANPTTCTTNPGTLNAGTVIQGSSTLQVKFVAGDPGQNYCARGLSAFPRGFWTTDYYAPLDHSTTGGRGETDYYLHNPHASAITVNWTSRTAAGSFIIPANSTVSYWAAVGNVPVDSGLYFKASDVFWGVGINDSLGATYEWGYSLLPSTFLYQEHFLGWAPGYASWAGGGAGNFNDVGVFLTVAQDNTQVFVDLNNDGTADQTYTLDRLQTQYIYDPTDGDLSQAHIWATGAFTMAYGENGDTAVTSNPSLDLGYVAIPGTDFMSLVLGVTKTASPQVVPTTAGSQSTFTITVSSAKYTVNGVNVTDYMPANWQYVAGTTTIVRPDQTTLSGAGADPTVTGLPATGQTLTWSSAQVGNPSPPSMAQNQQITITFTGQTTAAFAAGTLSQNRVKAVGTRTVAGINQTFTATNFAYVTYGNVAIAKASSVPDATPLYPGDTVTYTTTVTNPSGPTLTGVSIYDPMPAGVSYVAGSGLVTCERTRNLRDEFASVAYSNNGPNNTANWAGDWTETDASGNGATGATGGFVWITGGQLQFRYALSTVADQFASAAYNLDTGSANWSGNWTESAGLDGSPSTVANQEIYITGGRLRLDRATGGAFAISRTAAIPGGSTVTISFTPYDSGFDGGEAFVAEYQVNAGAFNVLATYDGGAGGWSGVPQSFTIPAFPGASITLRFRATGAWNANSDHAEIDNVQIAYNVPANAVGTQIQRTADLTGALSPQLTFSDASANLVAGDTFVVEASNSAAGPFTTLATFTAGTPSVAPPYDLTPYVSATTTIRFRVTGGFGAANKTLSLDNVDISYGLVSTFASGDAPEFLSSAAGCQIRPGGTPVTLTFAALVDNPLATGISSITNTASTTSAQFPIALSASVTNIVANPAVLSASVAGRLWLDGNVNLIQDIGEPGIANVEVTLKDQFGTPVAVALTDVNGRFLFTGVVAGAGYYVEATGGLPAGVSQDFPAGHSDNRTDTFALAAGQDYTAADMGYRPAAGTLTFGDLVWVDANANLLRDLGEVGLGGVTVQLYRDANGDNKLDALDTLVATTTSAPDGSYLFTNVANLPAGATYFVSVTGPANYTATTDLTFRFTAVVGGTAYLTADAGLQANGGTTSYSITDRVWYDTNGDGIFSGEQGIAGITMEVLDASLNVIGTTVTDANGLFTFTGLAGNGADYTTHISDTSGLLQNDYGTTSYAIARRRAESNLVANVDRSAAPSYGFRASRSIGETVFSDVNGNGAQDAGEPGLAGVVVSLYRDTNGNGVLDIGTDQVVGNVTTDVNGQYQFPGLTNGNYIVSVNSAPSGYTYSGTGGQADTDPAAGQQQLRTMAGNNVTDADFPYRPTVPRAIAGTIWNDADANGAIGGAESRLAGVTVDILFGTTVVATETTDATGAYSASGLAGLAGYTVRVTDTNGVLTGYTPTYEVTEGTISPFNYQESVDLSGSDAANLDFGYQRPAPTYAAIAYLKASLQGNGVTVEWRTALERGTLGFHLLRFDPATKKYRRVNQRLLPGLVVHPQGGTYRFEDSDAPTQGPLVYKLVEVDVRGRERASGPYRVDPAATPSAQAATASVGTRRDGGGASFERQPSPVSRAARVRMSLLARERQAAAIGIGAQRGRAAKVTTREAALHYLGANRIAGVLGIPARVVAAMIQGGRLAVSSRGRAVPYLPASLGAGIFFYAPAVDSAFSAENVFRAGPGVAARMRTAGSSFPGGPLTSFQATVHREEDQYPMLSLFQDPQADFWVWDYLFAGYDGYDTKSVTVAARDVIGTGDAALTVRLVGGSDTPADNDYHVVVTLNGALVGEANWDGLGPHSFEFPVAAADVREGDNQVEVKAVLDPGISDSLFFLDSVDLRYERRLRADNDALDFTVPAGATVDVAGFSTRDLLVLDLTNPASPAIVRSYSVVAAGDGSYGLHFAASGSRYLAVASARARTPDRVAAWQNAGLRNPANRADYVLIAPASLRQAAGALAAYRNSTGTTTMVVGLEAVDDEFGNGIAEPSAITTFLRYASTHWATPPRYVTLVGRGTWDYKDRLGMGDNLVPPALVGSPNGLFVSDGRLADLAGDDGVPEVSIGRLPVLTSQELLDYVAKVTLQESGAGGTDWRHRVLMAADDPDAGGAFPTDSDAVAALVPSDHAVDRVYLTQTTASAGKLSIRAALDQGRLLFNYIGHGALDRLAQEDLFASPDVALLSNAGRLPVFVAMTCSVGDFGHPGYPSLGEAMLLRKNAGAAAVLAPSGLSENDLAVRLDKAFFEQVFVHGERGIGNAWTQGLAAPDAQVPGIVAIKYMINLLGEPVSRLPQ